MSDALVGRLQVCTRWMIMLCLAASSMVLGIRIPQGSTSATALAATGEVPSGETTGTPLTQEEYLATADEICDSFSADDFIIMPKRVEDLGSYLGDLSAKARELHDALVQIQLPEGDTRELALVLENIEQNATQLSQAVDAIGKDGDVAVEMAFEPSYAQALLADLRAGIHAWRAGLRSCGPRPLDSSETNDIGEELNSKVR